MYTSILCLVALNEGHERVTEKAKALAGQFGADLHLLHVVEYVPLTGTEDAMLTAPISISEELEQRAREQVRTLAESLGVPESHWTVVTGDLISELNAAIQEYSIDLAVVGNHQRKGLSALFNHAEDAVLHRCGCDVLAVQLSA